MKQMPNPRRIDKPEPGFFRLRLVRNGPWVGARIYTIFGMFAAEINGVKGWDVDRVWTSGKEITQDEYDDLLANAPEFAFEPVDMNETKPVF
jgi:hypothetical protein